MSTQEPAGLFREAGQDMGAHQIPVVWSEAKEVGAHREPDYIPGACGWPPRLTPTARFHLNGMLLTGRCPWLPVAYNRSDLGALKLGLRHAYNLGRGLSESGLRN